MKKRLQQGFALALLFITLASFEKKPVWTRAGSNVAQYDMGDQIVGVNEGPGVVTIRSKTKSKSSSSEFGILKRTAAAETYAGKRVRVSGLLKASEVNEWGGFFINVNQTENQEVQLSNLKHTVVKGNSTSFVFSEIVVDVPANSTGITYGTILKGSGQISAARLVLDVVNKSVSLTK